MEIGPGFKISVNGYLLLKRQEPARNCYVWLGGETPQIAKGFTTQMADDTAQTVEKPDIRKAYKFGGEQISFTTEEQQALRSFGDPVIRIIGFKPLSVLPFWANIKHPSFIYPSEEDYIGSTRVFSALQQKLLKSQKLALVWFIPRKNASPVLAAMIAGEEKVDENGVQKVPPGMWIVPLPFADDVRQNPESKPVKAPDELVDKMRQVIQQLQLPKGVYDPQKYPNPCEFRANDLKKTANWIQHFNGITVYCKLLPWMRIFLMPKRTRHCPNTARLIRYDICLMINRKPLMLTSQRAGEYVLEWAGELEAQIKKLGLNSNQTTLVKRGPKEEPENAGDPPAKRVKTESGDVDNEVKRSFEKGAIAKVGGLTCSSILDSANHMNSSRCRH